MFYQIIIILAAPVFAQGEDYGLSFTAEQASLAANPNLPHLIGGILGTVLSLVGILFFALMLYGGITWMTARGAADQEKKALSTITAAIIGILIVLGSYAITQFVFKAIQGSGGGGGGGSNKCTEKHSTWACQNRSTCKSKEGETKSTTDCIGFEGCELFLCSEGEVCCLGGEVEVPSKKTEEQCFILGEPDCSGDCLWEAPIEGDPASVGSCHAKA